jgi:hypothetical protein
LSRPSRSAAGSRPAAAISVQKLRIRRPSRLQRKIARDPDGHALRAAAAARVPPQPATVRDARRLLVLTAINLAACTAYLYFAPGAVYAAAGATRFLKAALLTVAVGAMVLGYRFLIFLITLYVI